jgi:hypothetical protein
MTFFCLPIPGDKRNCAEARDGSASRDIERIRTNAAEYPPALAARKMSSRLVMLNQNIAGLRLVQNDWHYTGPAILLNAER